MPFQALPALQTRGPEMGNAFAMAAQIGAQRRAEAQQAKVKQLRQNVFANPTSREAQNALAIEAPNDPAFARLKAARTEKMEDLARGLQWAKGQEDIPAALALLQQHHPDMVAGADLQQMAENPAMIDMAISRVMTVQDVLANARDERDFKFKVAEADRAQANADRGFGLERARFGETQRHNRASEASARVRARTPMVNVNTGATMPQVGTIPQGYELAQVNGAWQMRPIVGGPAARDVQENADKAGKRAAQTIREGDIVIQDANRIIDIVENSTLPVTGAGSLLNVVPGTQANDVQQLLETLKAVTSLNRLQAMREASPTGGALGNVTEREGERLAASYGSLAQSQTESQFVQNLRRFTGIYEEIVHGAKQSQSRPNPGAVMERFGPQSRPAAPQSEPSGGGIESLLQKYGQ